MASGMLTVTERSLVDYYCNYCELTIWLKKIILRTNSSHPITRKDITTEFINERNRVLSHVAPDRRRVVRTYLNKVATSHYYKVAHWSKEQRITMDMV